MRPLRPSTISRPRPTVCLSTTQPLSCWTERAGSGWAPTKASGADGSGGSTCPSGTVVEIKPPPDPTPEGENSWDGVYGFVEKRDGQVLAFGGTVTHGNEQWIHHARRSGPTAPVVRIRAAEGSKQTARSRPPQAADHARHRGEERPARPVVQRRLPRRFESQILEQRRHAQDRLSLGPSRRRGSIPVGVPLYIRRGKREGHIYSPRSAMGT